MTVRGTTGACPSATQRATASPTIDGFPYYVATVSHSDEGGAKETALGALLCIQVDLPCFENWRIEISVPTSMMHFSWQGEAQGAREENSHPLGPASALPL